jgi:hypothetical protein
MFFTPPVRLCRSRDCGKIYINSLDAGLNESNGRLLAEHDMAELILQRCNYSHKSTYGNVGIIGGAGMGAGEGKAVKALLAEILATENPFS